MERAAGIRIGIVGGGSAGWMAAALLGRLLGPRFPTTLVESDEIGTVGVGEATIPPIKQFNALLGLDEAEFLRATGGTYKLGIEFRDWGRPGERYVHGFGPIGQNLGFVRCHAQWLAMRAAGHDVGTLDEHVVTAAAGLAGRFARPLGAAAAPLADLTYAFHLDAGRYAALLRARAEAAGVQRVEGRVVAARRDQAGGVAAVRLAGGREVAADLWLDCSGFRALLLGDALGVPWEDWGRWLPCDRALALPSSPLPEPPPLTRAWAHGAGWRWCIPLQHRTGNGIVYAGAAMADDAAHRLLVEGLDGPPAGEPRPLRFRAGRRREAWSGNVVGVGLAAGFLEPLESTSLHLVQSALLRLVALLPAAPPGPATVTDYNRQTAEEWEGVRDFVILHYLATARTDTPFWRERAATPPPDSLAERFALWREQGRAPRRGDELFAPESWIQLLVGQGVVPAAVDPLVALREERDVLAYLLDIRRTIARRVAGLPSHRAFLAQAGALAR